MSCPLLTLILHLLRMWRSGRRRTVAICHQWCPSVFTLRGCRAGGGFGQGLHVPARTAPCSLAEVSEAAAGAWPTARGQGESLLSCCQEGRDVLRQSQLQIKATDEHLRFPRRGQERGDQSSKVFPQRWERSVQPASTDTLQARVNPMGAAAVSVQSHRFHPG